MPAADWSNSIVVSGSTLIPTALYTVPKTAVDRFDRRSDRVNNGGVELSITVNGSGFSGHSH